MTPDQILEEMLATYKERNALYRDGYYAIPKLLDILFKDGIDPKLPLTDARFHLFELLLVKLVRYATSNFTHSDSIRDAGVYCALIESIQDSDKMRVGKMVSSDQEQEG